MDERRPGLPYVWVTYITGLLSGEKHCQWAAWYRSRYRYEKVPDPSFDSAKWNANHAALVRQRVEKLRADGWTVTVENENKFSVKGRTAILAGKRDIVARKDGYVLVSDAKTGKPRESDYWQVLIYMYAYPKAERWQVSGEVAYGTYEKQVGEHELTLGSEAKIVGMLQMIGQDHEPTKSPSAIECRYCDIASCTSRVTEVAPAVETEDF